MPRHASGGGAACLVWHHGYTPQPTPGRKHTAAHSFTQPPASAAAAGPGCTRAARLLLSSSSHLEVCVVEDDAVKGHDIGGLLHAAHLQERVALRSWVSVVA